MSVSDWYKRQKDKLKHLRRTESRSSTSLPNLSNEPPSPGPLPQVVVNPVNKESDASPELDSTNLAPDSSRLSAHQPVENTTIIPSGSPAPISVDEAHAAAAKIAPTATSEPVTENLPKSEAPEKKGPWSGLKAVLGVLKSGTQSFGPLRSAIEGLEDWVGIFERAAKARGDYDKLGEDLNQLLGDLAEFNSNWMEKTMTTSVRNLCSRIEAEIKMVNGKQERAALGTYLETTEDLDTILESYRRIHGLVGRLMLNSNLNMWRIIDEEMTDRRLARLSPEMAGEYNSWVSDRVKRRQCTEGTRQAELETLKGWVRNPSANPIYWINGMAGTGKTTIVYTLCQELDSTNELAASFFCTRLIPECRNVRLIIPEIACQLARFSYPFRHALSKALESDPAAPTRELKVQFEKLIVGPLRVAHRALPSIFIVLIDALDECDDHDSVGKLLDLLVASTTSLPFRLLVSSRPEPEIHDRMMKQVGDVGDARLVLHELDVARVRGEIETYIRAELNDLPLTAEKWNDLLDRCGALFIYAATVCRFIKFGKDTMGYEEAVETVLKLSPERNENTEKELDQLYTTILKTAFDRPQIADNKLARERMKMILDTIICAQEPMSIETLADLLELQHGDRVKTLLRPLFSVINIVEETGIVTTLHASFPDFMLSRDRSGGFHCDATERHIELTKACLKRVKSNPVQFNICKLESSYVRDRDVADLSERVQRAIPPALLYACLHWVDHLELAGLSQGIIQPVFDLLSARLLLWMEVMNLKGLILSVKEGLERVEKWSRQARISEESMELAHDAYNFVSSYHHHNTPVNQSTPHIYISMLPFWPSDSPIAKHYIPRTTGIPQPKGTALARRHLPRKAIRYTGKVMRAVCYSPDGKHVAVAVGNDVYIFDGCTGQTVLGPLEGHTDLVTSVAISPDGSHIASGAYDAFIIVWDSRTGRSVTDPIKAHRGRVTSVAFSPDGTRLVSTGAFDTLRVWSVQSGEQLIGTSSTSESNASVSTAVFSANGSQIISAGDDGTISCWDASTGNLISEQIGKHSATIKSITLSADGSRAVCTYKDSDITVCVRDTMTQQVVLGPLKRYFRISNRAVISPSGSYVASCADDFTIYIWDARTGELVTILFEEHRTTIHSLSFSPDSSRLISCSEDGYLHIWNTDENDKDFALFRRYRGIHSACFSTDGSRLVTGGEDGSICLWDVNSADLVIGPLTGHKGYICSVAISSDGLYIASASSDKTIRLWDILREPIPYRILEHHTKRPDLLKFAPDNSRLFYGSLTYFIGVSSPDSAARLAPQYCARDEWAGEISLYKNDPERPYASSVSTSKSGNTRYIGYLSDPYWKILMDKQLQWGNDSRQTTIRWPPSGLSCTVHSPDSSYIASGSNYGTIHVWHAKTGQLIIGPLQAHSDPISTILFSPDGTHLVTCSWDETIRFWPLPGNSAGECVGLDPSDCQTERGTSADLNLHWKLDDEWIVNDRNELLAWVPKDLRLYLLHPENDQLISARGSFKMDFTDTNIGKRWVNCYRPA